MTGKGPTPIPRATYRLQLTKEFGFAAAAELAPYLSRLGISHAYLSPILMARAGSQHGYDTIDHTQINPELGGLSGFRHLAEALRSEGIGIIVDFVPNHMGVGGADNPYWLDVLEWGEAAEFADWFDIDWRPTEPTLLGKVLVPFLAKAYGTALTDGDLALRFDSEKGELAVWAHDHHKLPLAPPSYAAVLGRDDQLKALAERFASVDPISGKEEAQMLKAELRCAVRQEPEIAATLDRVVAGLNGHCGDFVSKRALDAIIGQQHWRPAKSDVANDDINYRRFFIISDLAAIRIERVAVFEHAHKLLFSLIEEGLIEGLRVDHIDGLWDPKAYCETLRVKAPQSIYVVIEKILASGERLPQDWRIDGTTGYEFSALVTPLLTDPSAEAALTGFYHQLAGQRLGPGEIERRAKIRVMEDELAAEIAQLTQALLVFARRSPQTVDFTGTALRRGLQEIIASLPVYRTYIDASGISPQDTEVLATAVADVARRYPALDADLLTFLRQTLIGKAIIPELDSDALKLARRVQQFTGPVVAKGLEDTALYRYNRLIALNDVGERPNRFSAEIEEFHAANLHRLAHWPNSMLASSSHDSKRGEDARARISVLSGHAARWAVEVPKWLGLLREQGVPNIDVSDAYLFFQMLLGSWPAEFARAPAPDRLAEFEARISGALCKSMREARLRTLWTAPAEAYEADVGRFVHIALSSDIDNAFLSSFTAFEDAIGRDGALNGLIATALKLTVPGVPDTYQGAELWEQSMVDPDNRRPVDFAARREILGIENDAFASFLGHWRDGAIKLRLIQTLLQLRRTNSGIFSAGSYEPIHAADDEQRCVAFVRRHHNKALLVAVQLYPWRGAAPVSISLPRDLDPHGWSDTLSGLALPEDQCGKFAPGLPILIHALL